MKKIEATKWVGNLGGIQWASDMVESDLFQRALRATLLTNCPAARRAVLLGSGGVSKRTSITSNMEKLFHACQKSIASSSNFGVERLFGELPDDHYVRLTQRERRVSKRCIILGFQQNRIDRVEATSTTHLHVS